MAPSKFVGNMAVAGKSPAKISWSGRVGRVLWPTCMIVFVIVVVSGFQILTFVR